MNIFADVVDACHWVVNRLIAASISNVRSLPAKTHPVVCADWLLAGSGKPTILIFGHFDVQPVDPLDLWDTPPFKPVIRNYCLFGRKASDDKGNMLAPIVAIEAFLKTIGSLPVNVKFFY